MAGLIFLLVFLITALADCFSLKFINAEVDQGKFNADGLLSLHDALTVFDMKTIVTTKDLSFCDN